MKEVYDIRGRQSSIFRLAGFDREGLLHMVAYRILIFVSIVVGAAVLGTLLFAPHDINAWYIDALVLLVWALITPQVYETARAFALILSRGLSSQDLNQSFVNFAVKNKSAFDAYRAFPYLVLGVWMIGFVVMFWVWIR